MVIKVTNSNWMKGRWWQWKQWERVKVLHAELLPNFSLDNVDSSGGNVLEGLDSDILVPEVLKKLVPTPKEAKDKGLDDSSLFVRSMGFFINTSHKVEYEVYWCGVQGLFELDGMDPMRYMMILGEMAHAPPEVFQTIVGQAMVRHHWTLTFYWGYLVDRFIDVAALVFIHEMATFTHIQTLPSWGSVYGTFFFVLLNILSNLCAHIQCMIMYKSLKPVMSFWNIVFASLDLVNLVVLTTLIYGNYNVFRGHWGWEKNDKTEHFAKSFFAKHPVVFAMLVAGKWFYLMLKLLNLEFIGTAILPVWESARSRGSLVFLFYLMLGTFACAHSYYSFAIDDIPDVLMAFFRMVRLTFLGDFDVMEIMGVDQHMYVTNVTALYDAASLNNTNMTNAIVASLDDDDQPMFKYGIRAWSLMWAFIGPVIFINIYIGLLGAEYDEALANIEAIFAQFRISTLMMNLLRRHFWLHPVRNVCRFLCMACSKASADNYVEMSELNLRNGTGEFKGYWIAAPAKLITREDTTDDVSDKLDDIAKQTGIELEMLQTENAALKKQMAEGILALQQDNSKLKEELQNLKTLLQTAFPEA